MILAYLKNKISSVPPFMLIVVYVILFALLSVLSPYFLYESNLSVLLHYSVIVGVCAIAMAFVILIGEMDFSIGAIVSLSSVIVAKVLNLTNSPFLAIIVGLICGIMMGALNGLLVSYLNLNAFFVTLANMWIFTGIANLISRMASVSMKYDYFSNFTNFRIGTISVAFIILVVIYVLIWVLIRFTIFGRKICAVGSNKNACYLSGINIKRTRFLTFVLCGFISSIGGIMYAAQLGLGFVSYGIEIELNIILAVILSGASTTGGKIYIFGIFVAILFLATLDNGLRLLNVSSFNETLIKGLVLLVVLLLEKVRFSRIVEK